MPLATPVVHISAPLQCSTPVLHSSAPVTGSSLANKHALVLIKCEASDIKYIG